MGRSDLPWLVSPIFAVCWLYNIPSLLNYQFPFNTTISFGQIKKEKITSPTLPKIKFY